MGYNVNQTKERRCDAFVLCFSFLCFSFFLRLFSLLCFSSQIYLFFRSFTLFHLLQKTFSVVHVMAAGTTSIVVLHSTFSHFPECLAVSIVVRDTLKHSQLQKKLSNERNQRVFNFTSECSRSGLSCMTMTTTMLPEMCVFCCEEGEGG